MIFLVTRNWDGQSIVSFESKEDAEIYCQQFLKKNDNYGGGIVAFEGRKMEVKVVQVVDAIKLL